MKRVHVVLNVEEDIKNWQRKQFSKVLDSEILIFLQPQKPYQSEKLSWLGK